MKKKIIDNTACKDFKRKTIATTQCDVRPITQWAHGERVSLTILTTQSLVQPVEFSSRKWRYPLLEMTGLTRISSTLATNRASSSFSMSRNGDTGRRRGSVGVEVADPAAAARLSLDTERFASTLDNLHRSIDTSDCTIKLCVLEMSLTLIVCKPRLMCRRTKIWISLFITSSKKCHNSAETARYIEDRVTRTHRWTFWFSVFYCNSLTLRQNA